VIILFHVEHDDRPGRELLHGGHPLGHVLVGRADRPARDRPRHAQVLTHPRAPRHVELVLRAGGVGPDPDAAPGADEEPQLIRPRQERDAPLPPLRARHVPRAEGEQTALRRDRVGVTAHGHVRAVGRHVRRRAARDDARRPRVAVQVNEVRVVAPARRRPEPDVALPRGRPARERERPAAADLQSRRGRGRPHADVPRRTRHEYVLPD
jgi:hypothetical protein